jgi:signal transduction histidine kinase
VKTGHAVRVAAATTAAIAVVYVVCAVVANLILSAHLTAEADGRLNDRLQDLRRNPAAVVQKITRPAIDSDGDHDVDDEAAIYSWLLTPGHRVAAQSPGAPALPASVAARAVGGQTLVATFGTAGAFRLKVAQVGPDLLAAGMYLAEDRRLHRWLLLGELAAGPVLLLAMFGGALLIGLRAQAPVEESRRRQLEFTADASHELRTPLSVIRAETDLALASSREPADYRDTLVRIRAESDRLRRLVEDMLWLARFDSQPPHREEGPADLVTVALEGADRFRSVGPAVTSDVPDGPVLISASPEWADRLAGVLLDNACRYAGPDGQVRITVTTSGSRAAITVEDSGPGIAADQRPSLFDRFSRATEQTSGAGLGLAIGDTVVRSTGGRWTVADSPLGGALLSVSWRQIPPGRHGAEPRPVGSRLTGR